MSHVIEIIVVKRQHPQILLILTGVVWYLRVGIMSRDC